MIVVKTKLLANHVNGMTVWPFVFVQKGLDFSGTLKNHERIHAAQQTDVHIVVTVLVLSAIIVAGWHWWYLLGYLSFYVWYIIEAILRGYRTISFEQEAYENENNENYLKNRPGFANLKYL